MVLRIIWNGVGGHRESYAIKLSWISPYIQLDLWHSLLINNLAVFGFFTFQFKIGYNFDPKWGLTQWSMCFNLSLGLVPLVTTCSSPSEVLWQLLNSANKWVLMHVCYQVVWLTISNLNSHLCILNCCFKYYHVDLLHWFLSLHAIFKATFRFQ